MDHVSVKDFQSLHDVQVELGRFTVVVGPSSSGKSAFTRALRTLASNSRGTGYISHGAKRTQIRATVEDTCVLLERGGREDGYHLAVGRNATPEDADRSWTKLGGAVPEEITKILGVPPVTGSDLHFAGQFDRPYLLDEGGTAVARVLGALTNVDIVFAAAREANRLRLERGATLKTRQADLASLIETVQRFQTLGARVTACDAAEVALLAAEEAEREHRRLAAVLVQADQSADLVAEIAPKLATTALPDLGPAQAAQAAVDRFMALVTAVSNTNRQVAQAAEAAEGARQAQADAETVFHDLLTETGTCPLCNQSTKELTSA